MSIEYGDMTLTLLVRADTGTESAVPEMTEIGSVTGAIGACTAAEVGDALAALMEEAAAYLRSR